MQELNELSDTELLFQILTFIAPLSGALRQRFEHFIVRRTYPKKHRLLAEGEINRHIYFIRQGFARAFFLDREGREHTTWFMGAHDLMISVYSFYTQRPAAEYIELLEDSVLLSMTWDQLQTIYAEFPEYNYHGRLVTERYYIQSEERAILLRTKDPAERYQLLLEKYPGILEKASLGQIASFLGITQETLSRIRGRRRI
ncbi:Crp/Fnr family transcriptional regulator [Mucilaginibacter sp. SG564]|uniref:Crp/Fnr family transcriptional regulator n=1 Tax=Mucilaginibacter sp. SG564 TaxID=2587022 RepID=UPI001557A19A|nr:Crp/Fnr family transcriptional regulator [Mucilaginibacter sp. SG564]NOW95860.1 CRP-like cAMP-binding protein [Mucilaginibacter sp. SG564]